MFTARYMKTYSFIELLSKHHHRVSLFLLIIMCIAVNIPFFSSSYYPVHDTLEVFQTFSYFYQQVIISHEIPLWLPATAYGLPADGYLYTLGPFQYLSLIFGFVFNIQNALVLFTISLVGDTLFLALGTYLFCRHNIKERWIPIVCVFSMVWLVPYDQQIYFNFKVLLPIPLSLYWMQLGVERLNLGYIFSAFTNLLCWTFGSAPYFLPVQFYVVFCFGLCLFLLRLKENNFHYNPIWLMIRNVRNRNTLLFLFLSALVFFICSLMTLKIKSVMLDEMSLVSGTRNADLSVPIETFLTYAGNTDYKKVIEMFNGLPSCTNGFRHDFLAFTGLINVIFVIYSLFSKPKIPAQIALTITALLAISFTIVATGVPWLAYHLPGMNMVRHIGYFITIGKLLLIMLSGFGIHAYLYKNKN